MSKHKRSLWTWLIVSCFFAVILTSTLRSQSQDAVSKKDPQTENAQEAEKVDTSQFPVADYLASEPSNLKERAKREAKGKKYNSRYAAPITESHDESFWTTDWDVGLPAIPVAKSAAVIIGKITKAQAHLSENKTNIYSEFEVQIEQVLKSDRSDLSYGTSIVVERAGGRVRFPSGKIAISVVSHQQMPQIGSRYALFLTHDGPLGGERSGDFFILTGYELRDNCVFPLDKTLPGHPITAYRGVDERKFFNDLGSALNMSTLQ
jgi:hypothetical protein